MISIVTGPPGNGKSLLEQSVTIEELIFGQRDIVTSTPLRHMPWVTGDGRVMLGLQAYMRIAHKIELPPQVQIREGIVAIGRLLVVEDETELSTLFMWRRDRVTGDWFKLRWDVDGEQFNREDLARIGGGQFIVTDEAWKCYSSRRWKDSEKVTEFYGRQHRKFGDDWHLVSHSHKDLDVQINRMAQLWQICTNYGLRRLSIFRQPPYFEVKTFYEPPTSVSARPMVTTIRKLDVRVAQTYDTSAGVAVGGGRGADVKRRRKGISLAWLFVGVVILLILMAMIPKFLGMGAGLYMKNTLGIGAEREFAPAVTNVPAEIRPQSSTPGEKHTTQTKLDAPAFSQANTNALLVAGDTFDGRSVTVMFTDGSIRRVRRQYRRNDDGTVLVDGVQYGVAKVLPGDPITLPPSPPVTYFSPAGDPVERSPSVSVTVIGARESDSTWHTSRSSNPNNGY